MNDYDKCLNLLTSKEKFHIELGLNRVAKILDLLDNPQDKIKTIHIAGTNGKGSTCAILNSILIENRYKTGLFTSPHLEKYNERIQINSIPISDERLFSLLSNINKIANDHDIYLTEFEIITVAGFLYFAQEKIDIAIIEVGLGGRLDATNIIKKPILSAITSISKDHTDRLGNTIEKIAYEKAGIVKENSICCICDKNKGLETIKNIANVKNAKLITTPIIANKINLNTVFLNNSKKTYEFNLLGDYQEENLSLAISIIEQLKKLNFKIEEKSITNGLKKVKHNGRFEYIENLNLIIDGAHNPDGALALRNTLDKHFPNKKLCFIYSTINTKDYNSILNTLLRENDEIIFLEFKHKNAVNPKIFCNLKNINNVKSIKKEELKEVILTNKNNGKTSVLTGSLYAIGEMYPIIKILKIAQLGNIQ